MRRGSLGVDAVCSLVLLISSAGMLAQTAMRIAPPLTAPYKTATFPIGTPAPKGMAAPFFNHGYLIQFRHREASPGESNIYLYNSSGQLAHEIAAWPQGATEMYLSSVDVGANQQLAFSGLVTKGDGSKAAFIGISGLDGKSPKYFSTGDYLAGQIALAADGSVWAIGTEHSQPSGSQARWANYDTLRHYSQAGTVLDQFLPRWGSGVAYVVQTMDAAGKMQLAAFNKQGAQIATYGAPNWGPTPSYNHAGHRGRQVFLRSSGTTTVLYDGKADTLCQYDSSAPNPFNCWSNIEGRNTSSVTFTGFALTDSGDIYASRAHMRSNKNDLRGLYKLSLASSKTGANHWIPVPKTISSGSGRGRFRVLLGSSGNDLLYRTQPLRGDPASMSWSHR